MQEFLKRTQLRLCLTVAILLSLGMTAALTHPHPAQARGIPQPCEQPVAGQPTCHFSGFNSYAQVNQVDYSTCSGGVWTQIGISFSDNVLKDSSGPATTTQLAYVFISTYDSCSYTDQDYFGPATSLTLKTTGKMDTATLQATVPTADWNGNGGPTFTVNATWKGIGEINSVMDNNHQRSGDTIILIRTSGENRMAMVHGTITDGTTTYTIGDVTTMNDSKTGSLLITQAHQ